MTHQDLQELQDTTTTNSTKSQQQQQQQQQEHIEDNKTTAEINIVNTLKSCTLEPTPEVSLELKFSSIAVLVALFWIYWNLLVFCENFIG